MNRRSLIRALTTLAALPAGVAAALAGTQHALAAGPGAAGTPGSIGSNGGARVATGRAAARNRPLDRTVPVHPLLQYAAVADPDRPVRVIVQKRSGRSSADEIARHGGGAVKKDITQFRSAAMELPAARVLKLASHPDVVYVSPDTGIHRASISATSLRTAYPRVVAADQVWNGGAQSATGKGVGVAVLDSGCASHPDLNSGIRRINTNEAAFSNADESGHGTHVAGIIKGRSKTGNYIGVAPDASILSVKIADDTGMARASDLMEGMAWVAQFRTTYNIRVLNLSISSGLPETYLSSPICAAVEYLWRQGVVVVVASGNRGSAVDATWYPPANDPFVISAGALDDAGTVAGGDDALAPFSSRGLTQNNHYRPDVLAPGRRIVSTLASATCTLARQYPDRVTDKTYLRMSGTSMAAPVVAGVAALVLERYPRLLPDQVKWLLVNTASPYSGMADGAGVVNAAAALAFLKSSSSVPEANAGVPFSVGSGAAVDSAAWQTAAWNNSYWDNSYWDNSYWDNSYWDNSYWDNSYWDDSADVD